MNMGNRKSAVPLLSILAAVVFGCGSEASGDEVVQTSEEGNSITVEGFVLEWSIEENSITITAEAPTTGWIAVGFEPSAAMKDANIIIGYVENGELFIRDDWGDGHISHSPDIELGGSSDVTAIAGSEGGGKTTISFSIPLDSGDEYDRELQPGSVYKVILAYGPDDADNFQGYHAWADTIELEL